MHGYLCLSRSVAASLAYSYFKYREQQEAQAQRAKMAETALATSQGPQTNSNGNNKL